MAAKTKKQLVAEAKSEWLDLYEQGRYEEIARRRSDLYNRKESLSESLSLLNNLIAEIEEFMEDKNISFGDGLFFLQDED